MLRYAILILLSIILLTNTQCKGKFSNKIKGNVQDSAIYSKIDYSQLVFDSSSINLYLNNDSTLNDFRNDIMSFYQRRNYQSAWFEGDKLTEHATIFISRLHEYREIFCDQALFKSVVCSIEDSVMKNPFFLRGSLELKTKLDFTLTASFFKYADKEYYGINKSPRDLEWYIPRKKKDYLLLLDALTKAGKDYEQYEPVNKYYRNLKNSLKDYLQIQNQGGLPIIDEDIKLVIGQTSTQVVALKNYFIKTKDYKENDSVLVCNDILINAVEKFQSRVGLPVNGKLDKSTISALNVPISKRIKTIMINMERLRWIPSEIPNEYFLINIPEFKLHIYDSSKLQWSMRVVVGKQATNTAIFSDDLSYVVFSPYWNVPHSIVQKEILPKLKSNPDYLKWNNMEVFSGNMILNEYEINWKNFSNKVPYSIREKPGIKNSLGMVKFLFPNHFSIYMHDSPAKSLFENNNRAYSHGCVRLAEPVKLANYIFRKDTTINADSIDRWMAAGKEKYVSVKPRVPVFIVYFTSWVDKDGRLNFRPDIYGKDEKLAQNIFGTK